MDGYLEWEVTVTNRTTHENGEISENKTLLSFHLCNETDKANYLFKFKPNQKAVEEGLWPNLLCLDDPSQIKLSGHSTTITRNVVTFNLKRCIG